MVELNQLEDRVEIRSACVKPSELARDFEMGKRTLLVMDIDGGEWPMLIEADTAIYADIDILLEVHDGIVPGITNAIMERYRISHELTLIRQQPRTLKDFPGPESIPHAYKRRAMNECRGRKNDWIWMKSRGKSTSAEKWVGQSHL